MQVMEPNERNCSVDITANVLKTEKKSPLHTWAHRIRQEEDGFKRWCVVIQSLLYCNSQLLVNKCKFFTIEIACFWFGVCDIFVFCIYV